MEVKICTKCNKELTLDQFEIRKKTGLPRSSCRECHLTYNRARQKKWAQTNHSRYREYQNGWKEDNKEHFSEYNKARLQTDINYKIKRNLRSRLYGAVFRNTTNTEKGGSSVRDLGCSVDEFRIYLESKFIPGMSWDNYGSKDGDWNIDHITPLDWFDLTNRDQLLCACHYTNLQPMWASDNASKGNRLA